MSESFLDQPQKNNSISPGGDKKRTKDTHFCPHRAIFMNKITAVRPLLHIITNTRIPHTPPHTCLCPPQPLFSAFISSNITNTNTNASLTQTSNSHQTQKLIYLVQQPTIQPSTSSHRRLHLLLTHKQTIPSQQPNKQTNQQVKTIPSPSAALPSTPLFDPLISTPKNTKSTQQQSPQTNNTSTTLTTLNNDCK